MNALLLRPSASQLIFMVFRQRIGGRPCGGFDAERPDFDAVTAASFHDAAQLLQPFRSIRAGRPQCRVADFTERDGQPQAIDAFLRQQRQIFLWIVVDVVHQFVDVVRRPFDGAEEATGDTILQPRFPLDDAAFQKRRRLQLIHQPIDGAADAFRVACRDYDAFVDFDAIGLRLHGFFRLDDFASD